MSKITRWIEPGVIITLHGAPPSGAGGELARSELIPGTMFGSAGDGALNQTEITLQAVAMGEARYVGVWCEGDLDAAGPLREATPVEMGEELVIPVGMLELRRMR